MDQQGFVTLLNEDLQSEYRSIVQYTQHVATVKGPEYQNIIEELKEHLGQELTHATTLAEQIAFLGGVPTVTVPEIPNVPDGAEALALDLDLETTQLERYRERVAQANELGLPDVAEALRPLLQQTQDHVMDLQGALGK
ncbi:ferritin-like domain-containing protein [Sphaerisporangium sp. TRM90804]|uniref:ferritin-like domain-containing protein n=1 Tax=Sphaerisporangium sp. TRM90804 TaxID=3031113 RepID=UPI00244BAE5F|nr:ferritin-like domain-containing protein [Sphaerisporangium sp. TRM90804]MDH2424079.1 ferritin-like domain-containing protein [Sphaerisporangium sp. TRM90804]